MKRAIDIFSWLGILVGCLLLLSFSYTSSQQQLCSGLEINIDNPENSSFVSTTDVEDLVKNLGYSISDDKIKQIDIKHLEALLKNNSSIQEADVFTTVDGKIIIKIKERTPIIRIINSFGESFYLDKFGSFMPLSNSYSARVFLAHGNIDIPFSTVYRLEDLENKLSRVFRRSNSSAVQNTNLFEKLNINHEELPGAQQLKNLFDFALFLDENKFWNAQISQAYINETGDLILTPRVGNHIIVFGNTSEIEEKFDKLMIFYKKGLNRAGWNQYSTINLKFKNQIVCLKK